MMEQLEKEAEKKKKLVDQAGRQQRVCSGYSRIPPSSERDSIRKREKDRQTDGRAGRS